jgi:hypothetical protein
MTLLDVRTYEDLERYLREFTNVLGDPVPYDFVGAYGLFLAVLDNLVQNHSEANLEDLKEGPSAFTEDQRAFLKRLLALD